MNNVVLHLMVNKECTNDCPLCCNKQYDVGKIPVVTVEELKQTETICITGGEPFLSPHLASLIFGLIMQYKNIKNIYIYTSGKALNRDQISTLIYMQNQFNVNMGVSIGPKSEDDRRNIQSYLIYDKVAKLNHNRFYCFNNQDKEIAELYYKNKNTDIIDRKWQKNFIPAPNTIFRRLPIWI